MNKQHYIFFFLFLFFYPHLKAQNEYVPKTELVLLYESDLVVDAKILYLDTGLIKLQVIMVLKDNKFGIKEGDLLKVKKGNFPGCGLDYVFGGPIRGRFYLHKYPEYWGLHEMREEGMNMSSQEDDTYLATLQKTIVLPPDDLDKKIIEFQELYGMEDENWIFYNKVSDQKIKIIAKSNPIVAQFELEKRIAVQPIYIYDQERVVPLETALIQSCNLMEVMPSYNGVSDLDTLRKWIDSFVQLPETDIYMQGKVYLQFEISSDGDIGGFEIKQSLRSDYDQQAIEAVKSLAKWTPALNRGSVSSCTFLIPISFHYPENQNEKN